MGGFFLHSIKKQYIMCQISRVGVKSIRLTPQDLVFNKTKKKYDDGKLCYKFS